jgi:hypothetical protein
LRKLFGQRILAVIDRHIDETVVAAELEIVIELNSPNGKQVAVPDPSSSLERFADLSVLILRFWDERLHQQTRLGLELGKRWYTPLLHQGDLTQLRFLERGYLSMQRYQFVVMPVLRRRLIVTHKI